LKKFPIIGGTKAVNLKCDFCGKLESKKIKIVESPKFNVCSNCFKILKEDLEENFSDFISDGFNKEELLKPHQIKEKLDEYIIGQEDAKKLLSVAVYNHYKRLGNKSSVELQKTNVMLMGPTGSGKTYLIQILAKILNVPLLIVDSTSFTEAGYVGENVEDILKKLYLKANKDIKLAEKGIVYLDEVDKLVSKAESHSSRDVNGAGVQQALLKIVEDSEVSFKLKENEFNQKEITMNTKNILFIAGGAFVGLDKVVEERLRKNQGISLGFSSTEPSPLANNEKDITSEDIIKYGMIPEFVGRIPVFVKVNKLTDEELENILVKPKNCLTKQYKTLFKIDGVKLSFDKESLKYVVSETQKKKLGARGLRSVLEKQMNNIMYEIPKHEIKELTITKELLISSAKEIEEILNKKDISVHNNKEES
jgi:ATP-dependent Clp protease ATP-binding subunit ClpX